MVIWDIRGGLSNHLNSCSILFGIRGHSQQRIGRPNGAHRDTQCNEMCLAPKQTCHIVDDNAISVAQGCGFAFVKARRHKYNMLMVWNTLLFD